MEFKKGLEIIIRDLREAAELFEDISSSGKLPAFQSELIKTKCRSAIDLLTMLAREPYENTVTAPADSSKNSFKEKIVDNISTGREKEKESVIFITEEEVHAEMSEEKEEAVSDTRTEAEGKDLQPEQEKTEAEADINKKVEKGKDEKVIVPAVPPPGKEKTDKSILADKFGNGPARVSDKLPGINPGKDLSSMMNTKPVTDINDAIGLNDKFFYIRELFGGNGQVFSEVVKNLNTLSSMDEAREVIKSSAADGYNRDAMNLFMEIVARKLSSNG